MKKLIELYTIQVSRVFFLDPQSGVTYVVGMGDLPYIEFLEWMAVSGNHNVVRVDATGLNDEGRFYACFHQDCYDPPITIVRAADESEAIDRFLDEKENMRADPADVAEALEENPDQEIYQMSESGHWYDSETMQVREVKLHSIEV
jgi:hypothetical protein